MKEALFNDSQRLKEASIFLEGKEHIFKFKPMTGLIHRLALEQSKKVRKITEPDGTVIESEYYDDDRLRASIIYFQLLDSDGNRVFTRLDEIDEIEKSLSYETSVYLASLIGLKSLSDMIEEQREAIKKTNG